MTDLDATLDGATQVMASNMSIIGRDEINDMEAIFNLIGRIDEKGHHEVVDTCPAMFTWDYEKGFRPALDEGARTLLRADHAFVAEPGQSLADHRTRHREARRELVLGDRLIEPLLRDEAFLVQLLGTFQFLLRELQARAPRYDPFISRHANRQRHIVRPPPWPSQVPMPMWMNLTSPTSDQASTA